MSERPPSKSAASDERGWSQREMRYDAQANDPDKSHQEVLAKRETGAVQVQVLCQCGEAPRACTAAAPTQSLSSLRPRRRHPQVEGRGVGRDCADLSSARGGAAARQQRAHRVAPHEHAAARPRHCASPRLRAGADAVVSQFAVHYALSRRRRRRRCSRKWPRCCARAASSLHRANSEAILQAIRKDGDGRTLRRDGLLLQLKDGPDAWVNATPPTLASK